MEDNKKIVDNNHFISNMSAHLVGKINSLMPVSNFNIELKKMGCNQN